jgi:hypothetical protein
MAEIVIRVQLPSKRTARWMVIAGAVLGGAALVYAAVPNTFNAGDPLSSSKLNDNFSSLQGQITTTAFGTRTPSAFHATLTKATSPNVAGTTPIVFDQADYDLNGEYSATAGTFTAKNAGIYLATCNLFFNAGTTASVFGVNLHQNTTVITFGDTQTGGSSSDGGGVQVATQQAIQLAAGDVVTCTGGNESGALTAVNISNEPRNTFSVTRIY